MSRPPLFRSALPAIISAGTLVSSWWLLRLSWPALDLAQGAFFLAALVTTFVAIPAGAASSNFRDASLSVACQFLAAAIFLAMITIDSRALGFSAVNAAFLVLASWIAACNALPYLLRKCRLGVGIAIIPPALLAAILLAFPVVISPAQRALSSPGFDRLAGAAVYGCPIYGMFNATAGEMPSPWPSGKNRVMYKLTILDQNAANPAANWMAQSALFFSIALACFAAAYLLNRRRPA